MGPAAQDTDKGRSPAFANAYAVAYRLLGVRDMATDLAATVAASWSPHETEPATRWLPDVIHDATEAALALGAEYPAELAAAEDSSTRAALRRRLSGESPPTWVAVGLHHLCGYPVERTAALMGSDEATVERLCAPFAPPPGVSWASLGDPLSRLAGRVDRSGRRRRRIPWVALLAIATTIALVVLVANAEGERPSFADQAPTPGANGDNADGDDTEPDGDGSDADQPVPEAGGAVFAATLDPLPSSGCEATGEGNGPFAGVVAGDPATAEVDVGGVPLSFRVTVPGGDQPAPLVVSLTGENVDPASHQGAARLEEALPGSIHLTLPSLVAGVPPIGSVVLPGLLDDAITSLCVDLGRVFVVGHARGAPEATAAACAAPAVIVGAAAIAGAPEPGPQCSLDPPVAILVSARADDPAVDSGDALAEVGGEWAALIGAGDEVVEGVDERTLVRRWTAPTGATVTTRHQTDGGAEWNSLDTSAVVDWIASTARRLG